MFIILRIFVISVVFAILVTTTYKFIEFNLEHKKRMRKLNQWSQFHGQLLDWSKEIVDDNVRVNFINQCVHKLINTSNDKLYNNNLFDFSVEEEKRKICKEWGQHIPSLLQEIRDEKLKQLL
jgi:hypothetical protein